MNQIIMILLISLLVLVHEAGHFIAARIFGVRVTRFGIGMPFGPSWKMFRWQNTDFYIHAFLFGGYVSFPDDENFAQTDINNEQKPIADSSKCSHKECHKNKTKEEEKEIDVILPSDSPELYENKTIGQKLIIVSAGVIMNVVFAIILVIGCAIFFHKLPSSKQIITIEGFSQNKTSNVEQQGLQKGDKILSINNQKIDTLYQFSFFAKKSKMFDGYISSENYEENLKQLLILNPNIKNPEKELDINTIIKLGPIKAERPLEVGENVLKGLEKYQTKEEKLTQKQTEIRDEIFKNNQKTYTTTSPITLQDIAKAISDSYKPIKITVLRNGKEIVIKDVKISQEGIFGTLLKVEDVYIQTKTPLEIITKSFDYIYTTTATMLFGLWQLFSGKINVNDMHGVIAVVKVGGDIIASKGILEGILLTAMISINLAIMNILPIPALDGGHVMFLLIEKITGKKPSKELGEKITNFFFFLLILLMISICYNDIFALATKKF